MLLIESQGSQVIQHPASDSPFLLISSSGPAADLSSDMFGLYRKTEKMREGRSVYTQEHDAKYRGGTCKLFSDKGVWSITYAGDVYLRATTRSESPSSRVR